MINSYPIATICGTMRLFTQMLTVADELTRQNHLVLMPLARKSAASLHVNQRVAAMEKRDGKTYDHDAYHLNATPITGEELDRQHRTKIDLADLVVVVTDFTDHIMMSASHALYFGESTSAEIDYARRAGKAIHFARIERRDYRDTIVWLELAAESVGVNG